VSFVTFFVLAALAVGSAAGLLLRRNPIHGALFLVVNLGTIAALFLTLRAEFLAAVAGDRLRGRHRGALRVRDHGADPWQGGDRARSAARPAPPVGAGGGRLPGPGRGRRRLGTPSRAARSRRWREARTRVGRVLFTDYLFPFEVTSVLLLAAIVGVMALTKRKA